MTTTATPPPSATSQATRPQRSPTGAPQARLRSWRTRSAGPLPRLRCSPASGGGSARSPRQRARRRPRRAHPRRSASRGASRGRRAAGERRPRVRALPARPDGSLVQARHRGGSASSSRSGRPRSRTPTPKRRRRRQARRALTDRQGRTYRLELCSTDMSIPELRWHRRSSTAEGSEPVGMREAIASLESYEPVRTLTSRALALHRADPEVSTAMLRTEQARVERSEIVLNRGLRRAALSAAATQDLSMSEIAMRCGKIRCDARGKASGETSWLARRLGIAPEGGREHADAVDPHRRAGADRAPRSGDQPARGRARMTAARGARRAGRRAGARPVAILVVEADAALGGALVAQLIADGYRARAGA